jgi:hypothetical protein
MSKKNRSPWRKLKPVQPSSTHQSHERSDSQLAATGLAGARTPESDEEFAGRARTVASPVGAARMAANAANALLSTGPRTEAGLAKSSMNALKSALTGRTVLLPTDDVEEYAAFLADFERDLKPLGTQERELVQTIVDCHWRLRRIQDLEYAIYLRGERQFAEQFQDEPAVTRRSMIVLETHLAYQKELRNLHIQETRIDRKRKQAHAELKELQAQRAQAEEIPAEDLPEDDYFDALDAGYLPPWLAKHYAEQKAAKQNPNLTGNGFDFSKANSESAA